eukprot:g44710.t1
MTFKKSELLYTIILQRSRQQVARCQTSAPGIPATPTIIRLAPCFRLLQGARLLVLPTRDPSNPDIIHLAPCLRGCTTAARRKRARTKKVSLCLARECWTRDGREGACTRRRGEGYS